MRILAYSSSIGHRVVFGGVLRIQAWVCLRRLALASGIRFDFGCLVCTFGKALRIKEFLDRAAFGKAGRKAEVL